MSNNADDVLAGTAEADDLLPVAADSLAAQTIPQPSGGIAFGGEPGDYALWAANHMREKAREASKRVLDSNPGVRVGIDSDVDRTKQINRATAKSSKDGEDGGIAMTLPLP